MSKSRRGNNPDCLGEFYSLAFLEVALLRCSDNIQQCCLKGPRNSMTCHYCRIRQHINPPRVMDESPCSCSNPTNARMVANQHLLLIKSWNSHCNYLWVLALETVPGIKRIVMAGHHYLKRVDVKATSSALRRLAAKHPSQGPRGGKS